MQQEQGPGCVWLGKPNMRPREFLFFQSRSPMPSSLDLIEIDQGLKEK
jgi:hypothetical protein